MTKNLGLDPAINEIGRARQAKVKVPNDFHKLSPDGNVVLIAFPLYLRPVSPEL